MEHDIQENTETKWWSWKSPVGIGFFIAAAAVSLFLIVNGVAEILAISAAQSVPPGYGSSSENGGQYDTGSGMMPQATTSTQQ